MKYHEAPSPSGNPTILESFNFLSETKIVTPITFCNGL